MASNDFRNVLNDNDPTQGWHYGIKSINFTSSNIHEHSKYKNKNLADLCSVINVTEFQPTLQYDWYSFLTNAGGNLIDAGANALGQDKEGGGFVGGDVIKLLKNTFGEIITAAGQEVLTQGAARVISIITYGSVVKLLDNPAVTKDNVLSMYYNLITEEISTVHTFKIPYFGDQYISQDGSTGWSTNTFKSGLGDSTIANIAKQADSIINFPTVPTWTATEATEKAKLTTKLFLINDTKEALEKNFNFIRALCSGSGWVQTKADSGINGFRSIQKSPNLYRVECEGRMNYLICSQKVDIKYVGAVRRPYETLDTMLPNMLVPDVYELEISYESLIPNNYNTMLLLYTDGGTNKKIAIQSNAPVDNTTVASNVQEAEEQLKSSAKIQDAAKDIISKGGLL